MSTKKNPNQIKNLTTWDDNYETESAYVDPLILLQRAYTYSDEREIVEEVNNYFEIEFKFNHFYIKLRNKNNDEFSDLYNDDIFSKASWPVNYINKSLQEMVAEKMNNVNKTADFRQIN